MSSAVLKNHARGPWFSCTCEPTAAGQRAAVQHVEVTSHLCPLEVIICQSMYCKNCVVHFYSQKAKLMQQALC